MTDAELIEAAAKAGGIGIKFEPVHGGHWIEPGQGLVIDIWNPLVDDGQALRLAVKLRLVVHVWDEGEDVSAAKTLPDGSDPDPAGNAWHLANAHAIGGIEAAARRAIVRSAAALTPKEAE